MVYGVVQMWYTQMAEAPRVELGHTESKSVALPLRYAPMATPPFYSVRKRDGVCIIERNDFIYLRK